MYKKFVKIALGIQLGSKSPTYTFLLISNKNHTCIFVRYIYYESKNKNETELNYLHFIKLIKMFKKHKI